MIVPIKNKENFDLIMRTGYWPVTKSQSKKLTSAFEVRAGYL